MTKFNNYINGVLTPSVHAHTFQNVNPADTDDIIGHFPISSEQEVHAAVLAASNAFISWSKMPAPKRGDILRKAGDIFTRRKEELSAIMTREMGKPLFETLGDIQEDRKSVV